MNRLDRKAGAMSTLIAVEPGHEIECDRAKLTESAVLVRANGVWIELRPEQTMPTLYHVEFGAPAPLGQKYIIVAAEAYERWRLDERRACGI